jgi:hypothetical protein
VKTSKVISRESQEHFWHVVKQCLREFHCASPAVLGKVAKLRQRIDAASIDEIELFFHNEPFNIACGIARHELPIKPHLKRYLEIRDGQGNLDR